MKNSISVIGLGKLGLCLAACIAEKGIETIGVDINTSIVKSVNKGIAPFYEPGLESLIAKNGGKRLKATTNYRTAIEKTEISFIIVPTPSKPDGSFSNEYIESALRALASELKKSRKHYHVFVISSTVMPGSTDNIFIPIIEKWSGRKLNVDFDVCFDPDFVALGNVIAGFYNPDLVVIGETSKEAGKRVESIHKRLCENKPKIARMSIVSGEIAKICLNAFITIKVSFANSVANLCERIPEADVDAITQIIGQDRRISPYYFRGGLSFGGTCFPRDTKAFISLAEKCGSQAELVHASARVNQYQDNHLSDIIISEINSVYTKKLGILGVAFTLNTPVITESPSVKLIKKMLEYNIPIVTFDPFALENTYSVFKDKVEYAKTIKECLEKANICVVATRLKEYKEAIELLKPDKHITIIDCWRIINQEKLHKNIKYIPLGRYIKAK